MWQFYINLYLRNEHSIINNIFNEIVVIFFQNIVEFELDFKI